MQSFIFEKIIPFDGDLGSTSVFLSFFFVFFDKTGKTLTLEASKNAAG